MSEQAFFDLVSHIPYLDAIPAAQKEVFFRAAIRHQFAANEVIFLEGETPKGLWLIEDGQVKISKLNPDGSEYILHLLNAGNSFNDIAALENGPNPANASTLSAATCWLIPVEAIQNLLNAHPQVAQAAIVMLTQRVRALVQQLENLALYSVTTRLARFLLEQAHSPVIEGGVTRVAIAAHLATTPETISRALRSLEEGGAIQFNRHQIEIINPDILRAFALIAPS